MILLPFYPEPAFVDQSLVETGTAPAKGVAEFPLRELPPGLRRDLRRVLELGLDMAREARLEAGLPVSDLPTVRDLLIRAASDQARLAIPEGYQAPDRRWEEPARIPVVEGGIRVPQEWADLVYAGAGGGPGLWRPTPEGAARLMEHWLTAIDWDRFHSAVRWWAQQTRAHQDEAARLAAEREQRKEAVAARRAAMETWAAAHGSDRLREGLRRGYRMWAVYREERLAALAARCPADWHFGFLGTDEEVDEALNPTAVELQALQTLEAALQAEGLTEAEPDLAFLFRMGDPVGTVLRVEQFPVPTDHDQTPVIVAFPGARRWQEAEA